MNRPITTLFMLESLDGKISSGSTDNLDADKDFCKIDGVKEGLHQYYELEQETDVFSLNTGRVMTKIGVFEVIRFNNNLGVKPLIAVGPIDVNIEVGNNLKEEKISGIGYTFKYEYLVERNENSDSQINKVISGEFKLFDKFLLSAWVE